MRLDEIRNEWEAGRFTLTSKVLNEAFPALLTIAEVAVKLRKAVAHYEDCTGPNHDPEAAWTADGALDEAQAAFMEVMDAFGEATG